MERPVGKRKEIITMVVHIINVSKEFKMEIVEAQLSGKGTLS